MEGKVIRIPREIYQSLPPLYQVIAQIGEKNGQVVIIDENSVSKSRERRSGKSVPTTCSRHSCEG